MVLLQNQIQDLLCERNHQPAKKGQEAGAALGRVMGLQAHADLHHAPAQQDHANGLDGGKHKGGKIVDRRQWVIACGQSGRADGAAQQERCHCAEIAVFCSAGLHLGVQLFVLHVWVPP